MKLQARQIDSFLSDPGEGVLGALIFGADQGLVSERAQKLAKTIVDDVSDPFRVSTLTNDDFRADPARLTDELTSQSLTGGRRVVFLRVGGGDIAKQLGPILEDVPGDTLLIVEAGALTARSGLRKMFEKEANLVSIACYSDDGRAIAGLIDEVLGANGLTVQPDAKNFLLKQLGSDRLVSRRELEKLALFVGEKPSVSLEDTVQIIGDSGALSLEEVAFAVADGDGDKLEVQLARAFREGQSSIAVLRAVLRHFQRLHFAAGFVADGQSVGQAMKQLRPPILFLFADRFIRQLSLWKLGRMRSALSVLTEAERDCKSTGLPDEAVCHRALMRLSMAARPS